MNDLNEYEDLDTRDSERELTEAPYSPGWVRTAKLGDGSYLWRRATETERTVAACVGLPTHALFGVQP